MSNVPRPNPYGLNNQSPAEPAYVNPYQVSPAAVSSPPPSDSESIRKYYLSNEASIKSIGTMYFLGALLLGIATIVYGFAFLDSINSRSRYFSMTFISGLAMLFSGTLTIVQGICAWGLWRLRGWARILATTLSCFGVLLIPVGTLICGYFLYLLQCDKANVVFSAAYKNVIRETPHVKYKTPALNWIILGLVILAIAGLIIAWS